MNYSSKMKSILTQPFLWLDYLFDKIYDSRFNPLYQSGVLAVFLLGLVIVTGCYLVFFYKISSPYESVQYIHSQIALGRWIRSLHHYAANAAIVATFFHMIRMILQGRYWGTRTLAWISGIILTGFLIFSGISGLILVWDIQGKLMAVEMARFFDLFPIFSEPLSRGFQTFEPPSRSFFFLNLFMHVSLPVGLAFIFWIHTSRVARPHLLPPKGLMTGVTLCLVILSIVCSTPLAEKANALSMTGRVPMNLFYGFWLPGSFYLTPMTQAFLWIAFILFLICIPWLLKPSSNLRLPPSFVHEKSCTGCTSCYHDCPFDAISMVPRTIGAGSAEVAKVNPSRCISCGICSASCDPMGVGPPGRNGREQLKSMEEFLNTQPDVSPILIIGCQQSLSAQTFLHDVSYYSVHCSGGLHAAVVEYALRRGVRGVFIISCPPRNCSNREGPKWLHQRLYEGKESALRAHVDTRRVRLSYYGPLERKKALRDLEQFKQDIALLEKQKTEQKVDISLECQLK